jgi:hypothetical protein
MYLDRYPYKIYNNLFAYEFNSIGPKGVIRKIVQFVPVSEKTYNLVFGDLDESTGGINDLIATNNNDSKKVLASVAGIVHNFTVIFPNVRIFAKGSTHSRTRLYRMGITNNLELISTELVVYGYKEGRWESFKRGKGYDAFLVYSK